MPMTLPNAPYSKFTLQQRQLLDAAAAKVPAERRADFRANVHKHLRSPGGRGVVTDPGLAIAIRAAQREFSGGPAR